MFPVFAKAREKARQASCLSNMKQLGISFEMYKSDYDQTYGCCPKGFVGNDSDGVTPVYKIATGPEWDSLSPEAKGMWYSYFWVKQLQPYVKSSGIFYCPSDSFCKGMNAFGPIDDAKSVYRSSYAINVGNWTKLQNDPSTPCYTGVVNGCYGDGSGANDSLIENASGLMLLMEDQNSYWVHGGWVNGPTDIDWGTGHFVIMAKYHNDGSNMLFADTHAAWKNYAAMDGATYKNCVGGVWSQKNQ